MATKKDMRREELSTRSPLPLPLPLLHKMTNFTSHNAVVPYTETPSDKENNDFQGTISSTLPMAAVSPVHT